MFKNWHITMLLLGLAILVATSASAQDQDAYDLDFEEGNGEYAACVVEDSLQDNLPVENATVHSLTWKESKRICKARERFCTAKWRGIRRCGILYIKTELRIRRGLYKSNVQDDHTWTPGRVKRAFPFHQAAAKEDLDLWKADMKVEQQICKDLKVDCDREVYYLFDETGRPFENPWP